jgi:acetyl/propionyl-CoA carboxylase alpha subunit
LKYRLDTGEIEAEVEVSVSEEKNDARFTIGEREYRVSYQPVSGNGYHLTVNGKAVHAFVAQAEHGKYVFVRGRSFLVRDGDRKSERRERRGVQEEGPGEVTPPMPAVVVRIMVEEGNLVTRGQALVVVTAMKMEATLAAPWDGRVTKINTSEGAKVSPGELLVEIEKEVQADG